MESDVISLVSLRNCAGITATADHIFLVAGATSRPENNFCVRDNAGVEGFRPILRRYSASNLAGVHFPWRRFSDGIRSCLNCTSP